MMIFSTYSENIKIAITTAIMTSMNGIMGILIHVSTHTMTMKNMSYSTVTIILILIIVVIGRFCYRS
ncbi:MAG: hypothetical protein HQK54_04575 [Oligoflexales bacterium]|nr:hypothetical protein [Oligoflexales bacterium]